MLLIPAVSEILEDAYIGTTIYLTQYILQAYILDKLPILC